MDAARVIPAADDCPVGGTLAPLRLTLALASFGGLLLFGGVVLARWWGAGFSAPLGGDAMLAAGFFLAALAGAAGCWLATLAGDYWGDAGRYAARWMPLAIALASAAVLLVGAFSLGNAAAIMTPLVVVGLAQTPAMQQRLQRAIDACGRRIVSPTVAPNESDSTPDVQPAGHLHGADAGGGEFGSGDDALNEGVTQRWTRRVVDGWDTLEGWQQAAVERGARVVQMHVAICPAFAAMPEVSAELIDGEAASVRVAEATAFGIRVEARLDEPAGVAGSLTVAIVARAVMVAR